MKDKYESIYAWCTLMGSYNYYAEDQENLQIMACFKGHLDQI